jgi:hypothetical protein
MRQKTKAYRSPPLSHDFLAPTPASSLTWVQFAASDEESESEREDVLEEREVEAKRPTRRTRASSAVADDEAPSEDGSASQQQGQGAPRSPASPQPNSPSPANGAMDTSGDEATEPPSFDLDKEVRYRRPTAQAGQNDRLNAARYFLRICVQLNGPESREIPTQKQIQKAGMDTKWQQLGRNLLKLLRVVTIDTKTRLAEHLGSIGELEEFLLSADTEAELLARV